MDGTKKWWESEGIWGGLAAFAAGMMSMFGVEITAMELNSVLLGAVGTIGGVMAIVGRFKAKDKISA